MIYHHQTNIFRHFPTFSKHSNSETPIRFNCFTWIRFHLTGRINHSISHAGRRQPWNPNLWKHDRRREKYQKYSSHSSLFFSSSSFLSVQKGIYIGKHKWALDLSASFGYSSNSQPLTLILYSTPKKGPSIKLSQFQHSFISIFHGLAPFFPAPMKTVSTGSPDQLARPIGTDSNLHSGIEAIPSWKLIISADPLLGIEAAEFSSFCFDCSFQRKREDIVRPTPGRQRSPSFSLDSENPKRKIKK